MIFFIAVTICLLLILIFNLCVFEHKEQQRRKILGRQQPAAPTATKINTPFFSLSPAEFSIFHPLLLLFSLALRKNKQFFLSIQFHVMNFICSLDLFLNFWKLTKSQLNMTAQIVSTAYCVPCVSTFQVNMSIFFYDINALCVCVRNAIK